MKRRILAFLIILVLTALTIGMGLATSPEVDRWIRDAIVGQLEKHLEVKVRLGGFERNLFLTRVTFTDVTLSDLDGTGRSVTTTRLSISVDPYAFLRGTLYLKTVRLEGVSLDVTRKHDGTVRIEPLSPFQLAREGDGGPSFPMRFEIGEIILVGGGVSFSDEPYGLALEMEDVAISVTRGRFTPKSWRNATIRTGGGEVSWRGLGEGFPVRFRSFRADLVYTPAELRIKGVQISGGPLNLNLSGQLPFLKNGEFHGEASLIVDLDQLPWLPGGTGGQVSLDGNVGGNPLDPSFKGQLRGRDLHVAGRDLHDLEAGISIGLPGCRIADARVVYRKEVVRGHGELRFQAGFPYELVAGAHGYPLSKLIEEVRGGALSLEGSVNADLMVSGNLSGGGTSIAMEGEIEVPLGAEGTSPARFRLTGMYEGAALEGLDLVLETGSLHLGVTGSLRAGGPDLRVFAEETDLGRWGVFPVAGGITGSVTLDGEVGGQWKEVEGKIDATVKKPELGRFSADLMVAHLDIDRAGVSLPMLSLETGSSSLVGQGSFPWSRKPGEQWFVVEISEGNVEDLMHSAGFEAVLSGQIDGRVEAVSGPSGWEADGRALLRSGAVLEENFDEIQTEGTFGNGTLKLNKVRILKNERVILGKGSVSKGRYEAVFRSGDPVLLEDVRYLRKLKVFLAGNVDVEGTVQGKLDGSELDVQAKMSWDQASFEGRTWRSGDARVRIRDRELTATANLLDGIFTADAKTSLGGDFPFSGTIRTLQTADREALNDLLGVRIPADAVSMTLLAEAQASGFLKSLKKTRVKGTIGRGDLKIRGINFRSDENINFTYSPKVGIRFLDATLWSGESVVAGTLLIAPGAAIEGSLKGNVDLRGFSFLKPSVHQFSGLALVQLQVTGTLSQPVLNGSIRLQGAQCVASIPFDLPVRGLTGELEIVGNRLRSGGITGESGGGTIRMEGDLVLESFKPVQGELNWKAESVPVRFPEGLDTINRADIGLRFSDGRGILRGTVSMDEGRYTREVDIENLISLIGEGMNAPKNLTPNDEASERGDWLILDIRMETASPIDVDIKLLRGTANGDLHLQGTAAKPVLVGRIEIIEGTIVYRGHVFDVTSGSVGFFNPARIEPAFDFSGRTEVTGLDREGNVTEYIVDLLATGVPEKFKLDLLSSPSLSEIDIVSLLTWGAVGEQAFASRTGRSAAEATLLLTRELRGSLETGVRRLTGFDRVIINPSAVTSTGERTTRIQVDKRLSESVYLMYSTPVLTSEEQEVLLKYRLSDSFSLIGEQRGEEDFGLDLDFQFQIP